MSLRHDLGYSLLAWCWPFACWVPQCKYPEALMQKCRPRSLSHSLSATHIQPPSLADFMDVHCLTFSLVEYTPPPALFFFSSSLPSFLPSLSAVFCPASLHAWPALLWLLTSKSYFIHQSLIRERGPFSAALKEREGTRSECIKKEGERVYERRARERKRIRSWPRGTSRVTKAKKGTHSHTSTHPHRVTLNTNTHSFCCCFCPVGCVQMPQTWSLPPFSVYPSSFYLVFPSFFSLEPAVQRGVEACSFP